MHNKSVPNRNRLLRRIREFIKASKPQNIGASVKKMGGSGSASPVRIAKSALDEPNIVYARSADRLLVLNGNVEYERGDELPLTDEDQQTGTQGGLGNDGEDDFIVNGWSKCLTAGSLKTCSQMLLSLTSPPPSKPRRGRSST